MGMINTSLSEMKSGLAPRTVGDSTQAEELFSGSVPVIGAFLEYEKFLNSKLSWLAKSSFPLLPGASGSYVSMGGGLNYYFKSLSSSGSFTVNNSRILIIPKWRFHAGGGLEGAYLVYNTETAKKSDTLISLYGNTGVTYTKNVNWGYRGEISYARAIGFNTSANVLKLMLGAIYSFE
jgi:hypothetical protein